MSNNTPAILNLNTLFPGITGQGGSGGGGGLGTYVPNSVTSSINFVNSNLFDINGTASFNWNTRSFYDPNGNLTGIFGNSGIHQLLYNGETSVNWSTRQLYESSGYISLDWDNGLLLFTGSSNTSINWSVGQLYDSSSISLDYVNRGLYSPFYPNGQNFPNRSIGDLTTITGSILPSGSWLTVDYKNCVLWGPNLYYPNSSSIINPSLDWFLCTMVNQYGQPSINYHSRYLSNGLYWNSQICLDWNNERIYTKNVTNAGFYGPSYTTPVIDWGMAYINDFSGGLAVNWDERNLVGDWTINSIPITAPTGGAIIGTLLIDTSSSLAEDFGVRVLYDTSTSVALNWESRQLFDATESISIDWKARTLCNYNNVPVLIWDNYYGGIDIYDNNGQQALNCVGRVLTGYTGEWSVDWADHTLYDNLGSNVVYWYGANIMFTTGSGVIGRTISINVNNQEMYGMFDTSMSIDWGNRILYDASGSASFNYENRQLVGPEGNVRFLFDEGHGYLYNSDGELAIDLQSCFLQDPSSLQTLNWQNQELLTTSGSVLNWGYYTTYDSTTSQSLNWDQKILYGNWTISSSLIDSNNDTGSVGNVLSLNSIKEVQWTNQLFDSASVLSVDYQNRTLTDNTNLTSIDYQNRLLVGSWGTSLNYQLVTLSGGVPETASINLAGGLYIHVDATGFAGGEVDFEFSNGQDGQQYLFKIIQGSTPTTIYFPSGTKQRGGGGNVYTASSANNIDVIRMFIDETSTCYISVESNYF